MEGTHAGAGEEYEEERAAETTHDELTATTFPHPPSPCGAVGEEVENSGVEEILGSSEG